MRTIGDPQDKVTRRILAAFPSFPLADELKLELARRHRQKFQMLRQQDFDQAVAHADAARALASEVIAHPATADRRSRAEEILAHTPSRQELTRPQHN